MRLYFDNTDRYYKNEINENIFTIPFIYAEYIEVLDENPSEYSESDPNYIPADNLFYVDIEDDEFMSDSDFYKINDDEMHNFIKKFTNATNKEDIDIIYNHILDGYIDIRQYDDIKYIQNLYNIDEIDIYTIIPFIRIRIAASLNYKAVEIYNPDGANTIRLIPDIKMYKLK